MRNSKRLLGAWALGALIASAQVPQTGAATSPTITKEAASVPVETGAYILGVNDQIIIRATNAPDINEKLVRIDLDGNFVMPTIGRVHAAGLSIDALHAELIKRLKVYLEEPDVAVSVTEYQSQPISIYGEVTTPGVHQLQGTKRLVEILALAGGVRTEAGPSLHITRRLTYGRIPLPGATDDPTGTFSLADLDLKPLVAGKTPENDIVIQPYDVISIPKAEMIYVAGDITKSGPLTLNDSKKISIMEAVAASGGFTKTSDAKKARILRLEPSGTKRETVNVDVASILSGKTDDRPLFAGDILVIPTSNTKKAAIRAIEAAIQIGTVVLSSGVVNGTL